MAYRYATQLKTEHTARAVGKDLPISSKMAMEICNFIRRKPLQDAKKRLMRVISLQEAVPIKRYNFDLGHKKGIGPGKYSVKACKMILNMLESVEANAQFKGLNTSLLHITHLCSHKAGNASHYGRLGRKMKRTHVEVVVEEKGVDKK